MNLNLVKMARDAGFHVGDQFAAGCSEDDLRKLAAIITAEIEAITPPQRTWVGLTDEELREIIYETGFGLLMNVWFYEHDGNPRKVLQAIEAKLKEKNA